MDDKLKKREDEIENEYIARIYRNRVEYGLNNSMCKDIINKELGYEKAESTYRGIAKVWNECSEYMIDKQSSNSELEEVEAKIKGIKCGFKNTSCGDQLAIACREAYEAAQKAQ